MVACLNAFCISLSLPYFLVLPKTKLGIGILNVNADEVAGVVAGELHLPVIFLTDVVGVFDNAKDNDTVLPKLSANDIQERIKDGRLLEA